MESLCHFKDENAKTDVKFTYTAMHGVGYPAIQKAFEKFNLSKPIPVVEQVEVDPEFPTVAFPNPEEGKSALVSFSRIFLKIIILIYWILKTFRICR